MREILFRGKRKNGNEWVYGNYCGAEYLSSSGIEHLIIEIPRTGCSAQVDPETVGQYTGLTDKNGKKIFEGDIIKFDYIGNNLGVNGVSSVIFENCQFGVKWGFHKDLICLTGFANTTLEVIGNIHDNPELRCKNG